MQHKYISIGQQNYQKSMDQQKKNSKEDGYLDYIVSALHRKKKKNQQKNQNITYKKLYETMTNVVSDLDESINTCKKYNQAKIHRKYQIILNDQKRRIQFLEQKIKQQHKARSPSKKYVQDLLDKLINYKFQNQGLTKKNNQLVQQNEELKKKLLIYQEHVPVKDQKQEEKQFVNNNQSLQNVSNVEISGTVIKNQIISFLRLKNQLRNHQNYEKTKFQRFLKKNKQKSGNWTLRQFFQTLDKWSIQSLSMGPSSMMQSQQLIQQPKTQIMKPVVPNNSSISYQLSTSVANRSLNNKIQIRSKKTFSYRNFSNSRGQNSILR